MVVIVYRVSRSRVPEWLPLPATWDRTAPDPIATSLDPELVSAMRSLPPRQRAALWLRYCEDMTTGDVARIIGCSDAAARQLLLRVRDALRSRLNEEKDR
jgi:DNA-directed RNA polymerase specialized sigma24 family protein